MLKNSHLISILTLFRLILAVLLGLATSYIHAADCQAWTATQHYEAGQCVSIAGARYQAKWLTHGENPSKYSRTSDAWQLIASGVPLAASPAMPVSSSSLPALSSPAPKQAVTSSKSAVVSGAKQLSLPLHINTTSTFNTYDALGRLASEMDAQGFQTKFTYDANGNLLSKTDAKGHVSSYQYDVLNRLIQITAADGGISKFDYDQLDQLVKVTDPEGFSTEYSYNGFGELLKLLSPDTGSTNYQLDAAGNRSQSTDARGKITQYSYDALDRISKINYGDDTVQLTYDATSSRLTAIKNSNSSSGFSYDLLGRLSQSSNKIGAISQNIAYSYLAGRLTGISYPSGLRLSYSWLNGAINAVNVNDAPLISDITYQANGQPLSWTWANGQTWQRTANETGRTSSQSFADTARIYTYDRIGNITGIQDSLFNNRSQNMAYDTMDRLAQANINAVTFTYSYDFNGNRTDSSTGAVSSHYTHEKNSNRLLNINSNKIYAYDASGNRITDDDISNTYSNAGRLISSKRGTVTSQYVYNSFGQRVKKTGADGTVLFSYDQNGHLLGEYQADGKLIQETIWLGDIPLATIRKGASASTPAIYYIWADHLGTPRQISDPASKKLVWRWDGEAFGNSLADEDPSKTGKKFSYNLRFPGQYFDKETGKHYNYFRDYDPATGRYIESDPIGLAGGINTYGYVEGNPVSYADPSGLCPMCVFIPLAIASWEVANSDVPFVRGGGAAKAANEVCKDVVVSSSKHPEAAKHILDAIKAGHPEVLTIERAGASANRAASTGGLSKVVGKQLDEYPPAMFKEGGKGASVRPIKPSDNMGAGACIGNACRGLPDGSRVRIKVE
jgi:RHS repeat-associated protein